jgi:hypothetical protein
MVYQNCSTIKESLSQSSHIFLAKVPLLQYLNSKLSSLSRYESHLLTSTVLIYSTTCEAQSPPFPQSSDKKRRKALFVKFCNNTNDRIPSSKFHTFPHSDYATFEISTKTELIPSHIQENRHFNNLKYIKLEDVKTILCQFFKLLKDFHHFLMCLYSKTSTYLHVSNLILHTQQKNSREFQTST